MKTRFARGWGMVSLVLLLFSTNLTVYTPVQAVTRIDSQVLSFSDGEWVGKFSMYTNASTEVMHMVTNYKGTADFLSAGGKLDGEWIMNGTSTYTGDITGAAKFDAGGKVTGPSNELQFMTSHFIAHMDLTVGGVSTSQDVDMGTGPGMSLQLKSATCSQATADIATVVDKQMEAAGMQSNVSGSFTAIRKGDLSAANQVDYLNAVADLLDQAEALKQQVKDGKVTSFDELSQLVSQADSLNMAIKKNIECGLGGKKQFLSVITGVVVDIAHLALENPQLMTIDELNRLILVAVQVGAIGSGAVDPQQAADLEAKFTQELTDRLNDAKENKSCYDALIIQMAAGLLGNQDLKQQAQSVENMC